MTSPDRAEIVALGVLAWLAEAELLDAFQSATGIGRDQLREAASDPAFLGAVLDFALQRDDWVIAAAASQGMAPDGLLAARAALPGGDQHHWT